MKTVSQRQQAAAKAKQAKQAAKLLKYGPKASFSFRKNVFPPLLGIVVMAAIMGLLNGELIAAQLKYRLAKPVSTPSSQFANAGTVITSGATSTADTKSPHPELGSQLTIPSINVVAPVEFGQGTAEWQIQVALRSGVVHYDNSAAPGQAGNVAIFGHSSGQPWAPGGYKFIFTLLDKTKPGDLVYIDYQGIRYTYKVASSEVVAPTDVKVLQSTNGHDLTLITCTPVGTSKNRLVVHATQISPSLTADSKTASKAADTTPTPKTPVTVVTLPASAHGSLWQSIRNLF